MKSLFWEYGVPRKILSDAGVILFQRFQRILKKPEYRASSIMIIPPSIQWRVFKLIKWILKMLITNADTFLALLQIRSTQLRLGSPSPATVLFNHPVISIMPVINRAPFNTNNSDNHYEAFLEGQEKADKNYDTLRNCNCIPIGSTLAVQLEDVGNIIDKGDHNHRQHI